MAARGFNVVAQLQISAPRNLSQVVGQIKRELGKASVDVKINIPNDISRILAGVANQVKAINANIQQLNANAAATGASLGKVAAGFNRVAAASGQTQKAAQEVKKIADTTKEAVNATEDFGRAAGLAARRFIGFTLVAGAFLGLVNSIRTGVREAIEFEREFLKLSQIGGVFQSELRQVNAEITKLSTGLGVSSKELLKASVTLRQAGFSVTDVSAALEGLAKSALAPSFDNLQDTTEGAIAILAQFKIGVKDVESALSSINAVANAFAVESRDLIAGIRRAGGTFVNVGGDLNEFISLFTSVRATTRESAETIATGLRTIFTRLQRTDTIRALESFGIQLRFTRREAEALGNVNLEKQFVGGFEAIRRLSEGLAQLRSTDPRFSAIIEELGGYRQISKVIPLIQQFAVSQKALNVAQAGGISITTAADLAQQNFVINLQKTRESFLALFRTIVGSRGFETFTKTIINLANAFIRLADALAPIIPLLGILATVKIASGLATFLGGVGQGFRGEGPKRLAAGGVVPGAGNRDTVPAMLTPGEFVVKKSTAQKIGYDRLAGMNKGGAVPVQKFAVGGNVVDIDEVMKTKGSPHGKVGMLYVDSKQAAQTGDKTVVLTKGVNLKRQGEFFQTDAGKVISGKKLPFADVTAGGRVIEPEITAARTAFKASGTTAQAFMASGNPAIATLVARGYSPTEIQDILTLPGNQARQKALLPSGGAFKSGSPAQQALEAQKPGKGIGGAKVTISEAQLNKAAATAALGSAGVINLFKDVIAKSANIIFPGSKKGGGQFGTTDVSDDIVNKSLDKQGQGRIFEAATQVVGRRVKIASSSDNFDFNPGTTSKVAANFTGLSASNIFADAKISQNTEARKSVVAKAVRQFGTVTPTGQIPLFNPTGAAKAPTVGGAIKATGATKQQIAGGGQGVFYTTSSKGTGQTLYFASGGSVPTFDVLGKGLSRTELVGLRGLAQQSAPDGLADEATRKAARKQLEAEMRRLGIIEPGASTASAAKTISSFIGLVKGPTGFAKLQDKFFGKDPIVNNKLKIQKGPVGNVLPVPLPGDSMGVVFAFPPDFKGNTKDESKSGALYAGGPRIVKLTGQSKFPEYLRNNTAGISEIQAKVNTHALSRDKAAGFRGFLNKVNRKISEAYDESFDFGKGTGRLPESDLRSVGGYLFERYVQGVSGKAAAGGQKAFDFPGGLRGSKMNDFVFPSPISSNLVDAKFTGDKTSFNDVAVKYLNYRASVIDKYLAARTLKKAAGGGIGGTGSRDRVPAMLTPGEFVLSKSSATRIGKPALDSMNKTGKIPGFAKGGTIQPYPVQGVPTTAGRVTGLGVTTPGDFDATVEGRAKTNKKLILSEERLAKANNELVEARIGSVRGGAKLLQQENKAADQLAQGTGQRGGILGAISKVGVFGGVGLSFASSLLPQGSRGAGTIQGAGFGLAAGNIFGPVVGLIGGLAGALGGFIGATNDQAKRLREIRFEETARQFKQSLEKLAQGSFDVNSSTGTFLKNIDELRSEAISRVQDINREKRFLFIFGGLNSKEKREEELRQLRQVAGNELPAIYEALKKNIEDSTKNFIDRNDTDNTKNSLRQLNRTFLDGNKGINITLLKLISDVENIPIEDVFKKFSDEQRKAFIRLRANERLRRTEAIENRNISDMTYFSSALRDATEAAAKLTNNFSILEGLFEGTLANFNAISDFSFVNQFGAPGGTAGLRAATPGLSSLFGKNNNLLQAAQATFALADTLPDTIANAIAKGPVGLRQEDLDIGGLVREQLLTQFKDAGPEIQATIINATNRLSSLFGEDPQKALEKIQKDLPRLVREELLPGSRAVNEVLTQIGKDLLENANKFISELGKQAQRLQKVNTELEKLDKAQLEVTRNNARNLGLRIGREDLADLLPLDVLNRPLAQTQRRLAGGIGEDPNAIAARLVDVNRQLEAQATIVQRLSQAGRQTTGEFEVAAIRLQALNTESTNLTQALRNLTDSATRTAVAQDKLNKIQQEREARLGFGERFIRAGGRERQEINRGIGLTFQAAQVGRLELFNDKDRNLILDTLNSLANVKITALGGITGKNLRDNLIGASLGGIFRPDQQALTEEEQLRKAIQTELEKAVTAQTRLTDIQINLQKTFFVDLTKAQADFYTRLEQIFRQSEIERLRGVVQSTELIQGADIGRRRTQLGILRGAGISGDDILRRAADKENIERLNQLTAEADLIKELQAAVGKFSINIKDFLYSGGRRISGDFYDEVAKVLSSLGIFNKQLTGEIFGTFQARFNRGSGQNPLQLFNQVVQEVINTRREGLGKDTNTLARVLGVNAQQLQDTILAGGGKDLVQAITKTESIQEATRAINEYNAALDAQRAALDKARGVDPAAGKLLRNFPVPIAGLAAGGLAHGTDTVPAMLTPGEFVVRKAVAQKHRALLERLNSGEAPQYYAFGGGVAAARQKLGAGAVDKNINKAELDKAQGLLKGVTPQQIANATRLIKNVNLGDVKSAEQARKAQDAFDNLNAVRAFVQVGGQTGTGGVGLDDLQKQNREARTIANELQLAGFNLLNQAKGKKVKDTDEILALRFLANFQPETYKKNLPGQFFYNFNDRAVQSTPQQYVDLVLNTRKEIQGLLSKRRSGSLDQMGDQQLGILYGRVNQLAKLNLQDASQKALKKTFDAQEEAYKGAATRIGKDFGSGYESLDAVLKEKREIEGLVSSSGLQKVGEAYGYKNQEGGVPAGAAFKEALAEYLGLRHSELTSIFDQIKNDLDQKQLPRLRDELKELGTLKFAAGGLVPGTGSRDSVLSLLTPGEFVVPRSTVQRLQFGGAVANNIGRAVRSDTGSSINSREPDFSVLAEAARTIFVGVTDFSKAANSLQTALNNFVNNTNNLTQALTKFPSQLVGTFTHQVTVTINGAEAFAQMEDSFRNLAVGEARKVLNNYVKERIPDAGEV